MEPLLAGRFFERTDTRGAEQVVIIDEWLARRYWPDSDPIGRRLRIGYPGPDAGEDDLYRIVGVVGHIRQFDLTESETVGGYYLCSLQQPLRSMVHAIRTEGDPEY